MRVLDSFARWQTVARTLSFAAVILFCAVASAQINPGDPGWYARIVDAAGTIDSATKAESVLDNFGITNVGIGVVEAVDFAGGGGTFGINNPYPNGVGDESQDGFVVEVWADVTIPAGEWGIAIGSDDGGLITIPGVDFRTDRFNQNGTPAGNDQIRFEGNRGHAWTYGGFELAAPLTTTIHATMFENGGGDTFEVAVTDFLPFDGDVPTDADWFVIGDPESIAFDQKFDWGFKVPATIPPTDVNVAGRSSTGSLTVSGGLTDEVFEIQPGIHPGLLHHWYDRGNPGSYDGVTAFYDFNESPKAIEDPEIAPFNPENTWWTGNQAAITGGTTSAPQYPAEVIGQPRNSGAYNGSNNDNYTTVLSGQIKIPENGEYVFTDGIDDLTVLGIDVNRDGFFDDIDEFFINDNAWTSVNRDANGGGFTTNGGEYIVAEFSGIDPANEDTQWFDIELVAAEGGGDDAGVIYWDYDINDRDGDGQKLGDATGFPDPTGNTDRAIIDGRVIANEDLAELLIPEANLRGPGGRALVGGNINAALNGDVDYVFEINEDGTFDAIEVSRPFEAAVTKLDLNDTTIKLSAIGDVSGLSGEFKLLSADELSGNATLVIPAGLEGIIDSSNFLSTGILIFGGAPGIPGDIDGDGTVAFGDFLILSANFGQMAGASGGDIDGDGTVAFGDFLILSANFGRTAAAAAAVPEPTSMVLLGFGGLMIGLLRRRRR